MADQIPSVYGLESTAVNLYGTAISLLVITWTAALLRAYVRGYMLHSVGWDDWTLIPTLVSGNIRMSLYIMLIESHRPLLRHNVHIYLR
jgi:hypothetical protein